MTTPRSRTGPRVGVAPKTASVPANAPVVGQPIQAPARLRVQAACQSAAVSSQSTNIGSSSHAIRQQQVKPAEVKNGPIQAPVVGAIKSQHQLRPQQRQQRPLASASSSSLVSIHDMANDQQQLATSIMDASDATMAEIMKIVHTATKVQERQTLKPGHLLVACGSHASGLGLGKSAGDPNLVRGVDLVDYLSQNPGVADRLRTLLMHRGLANGITATPTVATATATATATTAAISRSASHSAPQLASDASSRHPMMSSSGGGIMTYTAIAAAVLGMISSMWNGAGYFAFDPQPQRPNRKRPHAAAPKLHHDESDFQKSVIESKGSGGGSSGGGERKTTTNVVASGVAETDADVDSRGVLFSAGCGGALVRSRALNDDEWAAHRERIREQERKDEEERSRATATSSSKGGIIHAFAKKIQSGRHAAIHAAVIAGINANTNAVPASETAAVDPTPAIEASRPEIKEVAYGRPVVSLENSQTLQLDPEEMSLAIDAYASRSAHVGRQMRLFAAPDMHGLACEGVVGKPSLLGSAYKPVDHVRDGFFARFGAKRKKNRRVGVVLGSPFYMRPGWGPVMTARIRTPEPQRFLMQESYMPGSGKKRDALNKQLSSIGITPQLVSDAVTGADVTPDDESDCNDDSGSASGSGSVARADADADAETGGSEAPSSSADQAPASSSLPNAAGGAGGGASGCEDDVGPECVGVRDPKKASRTNSASADTKKQKYEFQLTSVLDNSGLSTVMIVGMMDTRLMSPMGPVYSIDPTTGVVTETYPSAPVEAARPPGVLTGVDRVDAHERLCQKIAPIPSAYFRFDSAACIDGKRTWQCVSSNGNPDGLCLSDSGIKVADSTSYDMCVRIPREGGSVEFYINGRRVGEHLCDWKPKSQLGCVVLTERHDTLDGLARTMDVAHVTCTHV